MLPRVNNHPLAVEVVVGAGQVLAVTLGTGTDGLFVSGHDVSLADALHSVRHEPRRPNGRLQGVSKVVG